MKQLGIESYRITDYGITRFNRRMQHAADRRAVTHVGMEELIKRDRVLAEGLYQFITTYVMRVEHAQGTLSSELFLDAAALTYLAARYSTRDGQVETPRIDSWGQHLFARRVREFGYVANAEDAYSQNTPWAVQLQEIFPEYTNRFDGADSVVQGASFILSLLDAQVAADKVKFN